MTEKQKIIKYLAIGLAVLLIAGILSGICGAIVAIFGLDGSVQLADEPFSLAVESDGSALRDLVISLSSARLTIRTGDVVAVETNHPDVTCQLKEGVLTLSEERHKTRIFGISLGTTAQESMVTLTLPETVWNDLHLETGAGEVLIHRLCAKRAEMDFGAGNVEIDFLNVTESVEIEGGVGNVTVKDGRLRDVDFDLGVGDVSVRSTLEGSCAINMGIGSTRLEILGNESDYCLTLDKGIGKATVSGKSVKSGEVYGSGSHRIDIDGGIGSIDVVFTAKEEAP